MIKSTKEIQYLSYSKHKVEWQDKLKIATKLLNPWTKIKK